MSKALRWIYPLNHSTRNSIFRWVESDHILVAAGRPLSMNFRGNRWWIVRFKPIYSSVNAWFVSWLTGLAWALHVLLVALFYNCRQMSSDISLLSHAATRKQSRILIHLCLTMQWHIHKHSLLHWSLLFFLQNQKWLLHFNWFKYTHRFATQNQV